MDGEVSVERLVSLSEQDARDIERLMAMLSKRFADGVADPSILERIIASPDHDQLVARLNARIIGTATVSLVFGAGRGALGYLQDFVVDEEVRGKGVASLLWDEIIAWCNEHGVELEFTSGASKEAAHAFYRKRGAVVRDTTVFHVMPAEDESTEL